MLHPRPLQKQKAYHWRIFTPANNQTIWPLQWWIIAPAFSVLANTYVVNDQSTWLVLEHTIDPGNRLHQAVPKRFRAWYWHDISGVWFLEVRYGARALKLSKSGATSIVVGEQDKLVDIIGTVIEAVRAGELDAAIEAAAGTRVGLKRTKSRSSASA